VISQYTAQEVYTSRESIQKEIRENAQKSLAANLNKLVQPEAMEQPDPKHYDDFLQAAIQILDTLVLSIELPPDIVSAINRQTEQYYMIQEYKFRVEREAEESKRKQIEADGIAAFQKTVSQGISESYLRWRGIEATLQLAQSPNTKIVIVGSGKDGLPIILVIVDWAGAPGAPPDAAGAPAPGAPPTPAANTPPNPPPFNSSPAPPNSGAPAGAKPPPGKSGEATPPASDKAAGAATSSVTAETDNTAPSAGPLDVPGVRSLMSGISGVLRAGADLTSPSETKSGQ
jgi:hypothetical protein